MSDSITYTVTAILSHFNTELLIGINDNFEESSKLNFKDSKENFCIEIILESIKYQIFDTVDIRKAKDTDENEIWLTYNCKKINSSNIFYIVCSVFRELYY